jgi:hypothetical protein
MATRTKPPESAEPEAPGEVPEPLPPAAHVIEALARVMGDLGGIGKMTQEERRRKGLSTGGGEGGISYAYRGIDQIAAAAQPLFAKHCVAIIPIDTESMVKDFTQNGKPWTEHWVRVTWMVAGPGGVDDSIKAISEGLGRDNSDKGINKALTSAYKNLLLRLLCIGDPNDDTDHDRVEADNREPLPDPEPEVRLPKKVIDLFDRVVGYKDDAEVVAELKALAEKNERKLTAPALAESDEWFKVVKATLDAADEIRKQDTQNVADEVGAQVATEEGES